MNRREMMFALVERWQGSSMSKGEFAAANGLSSNTFGKWYKLYKEEQLSSANKAPAFMEITTQSGQDADKQQATERLAKIDIELPCGIRIKIY